MSWNRVTVSTAPTDLPISAADMKARLRVDSSDDDALITALIKGAVAMIDGPSGIGCAMMQQTWRLSLDSFPDAIDLPGYPVKSITSVTYTDVDGTERTIDSDDYRLDKYGDPARLVPAYGKSWPASQSIIGAVSILYVLGEASASAVSPALIDAVSLLVGHRYLNREAISSQAMSELPLGFEHIVREFRRNTVAS